MTDRSRPRAEKWIWIALGVGVIAFVSVIFYILQPFFVEPEVPAQPGVENVQVALAHAKTSLARGDFARARGIAEFVLESEPGSTDALLLAGEAATRMGDTTAAVRHYLRVPPESGRAYATSRRAAGNVRLAEAKLSDAEDLFRDALAAEPDSPITHSRLALILGLEGRVWESLPHQFATLVEGHLDLQTLLILAAGGERSITNKTLVDQATAISPNDPALWMGNARVALSDGEIDKAHELISRVLEIAPHFLEAHAIFGQIAVESDNAQLVNKWIQGLPDDAAKHPDIWYQQGVWLAKTGKQDAAARCFWESVKLLPISQRASYRLAQQLVAINRANEAKQLFEWVDELDKIRQLLDLIYENRDLNQPDEKMMQLLVRAAELMESMGRNREAWAWYRVSVIVCTRQP